MKRLLLLILTVCFLTTSFAQTTTSKKALELYNKAVEYYEYGDARKAINTLKKALKIDKNFSDAQYKLAEIYLEQENAALRQRGET